MNIMGGDSRIHKQNERRMLPPTVGYRRPMTPKSLCPPLHHPTPQEGPGIQPNECPSYCLLQMSL